MIGSVIGSVVGSVLNFNTAGIDFSMTALFLVVFVEQWKSTKNHASAITGVEFCYSGDDQYYGNINSDEEIQKIVDEVVTSAGLSGPAAMGKAMGMIKPKVAGKADMGRVSALLKARLAQ